MSTPFLFSGSSHRDFAVKVAEQLNVFLGDVFCGPFPDGEINLQILSNVRGADVFVVQSTAGDPNYNLMELFLFADALKRASAKSVCAVMPYFAYSRQDRKDRPRVPITAKLIADLLTTAGVDRVLTMDLHSGQVQGFFDVPVDNLYGRPVLASELMKMDLRDPVVLAPDLGAVKIARAYSNHLEIDFAVIDKRRVNSEQVFMTTIIGDVRERDVILVDDMCSTGGTMAAAARLSKEHGARRVLAAFTHGLFVGDALEKMFSGGIEHILTTDTVPSPVKYDDRVKIISVAPLFGEVIRRITCNESISDIFY